MGVQTLRRLRWSALILGLTLPAIGYSVWASKPAVETDRSAGAARRPEAGATAAVRVEAVRAQRADLSLYAEATGYLEPWRKVEVRAEVAGRVVERPVEEGGYVGAGALLVRLDDRDRQLDLEEARAEWLKAQAGYAVDYQELEAQPDRREPASGSGDEMEVSRAEKLVAEGLLPRRELAGIRRRYEAQRLLSGARQGEVRAATSGLAQAEQRVERSRLAIERTRIAAPFAGRVADLAVELGQQIAPGENLFTLLQDDRLKVDVDVLEADIVHLREGAPARVRVPSADGLVLAGTIYAINPRVDSATGTGKVTVAIQNPRGLLIAGLFAAVELETRRLSDRLLVPAQALLTRQGRDLVFRIENGRALWSYVQVGARSGDAVEVTAGLKEGDVIAAGGHFALAHEAPVEPVLDGSAAASVPLP